ncbi:hypothetical protein [Vibrio mediterranei]|uniref:hypothetical protein n=1 Tax=Vibrio mediterranei TaxID=689 RepID=UPI0022853164|nr:hypothetical protein [Vibrio mediterranei]MCY9855897.1 hypothetical protein [Vibrio mediterranei]
MGIKAVKDRMGMTFIELEDAHKFESIDSVHIRVGNTRVKLRELYKKELNLHRFLARVGAGVRVRKTREVRLVPRWHYLVENHLLKFNVVENSQDAYSAILREKMRIPKKLRDAIIHRSNKER